MVLRNLVSYEILFLFFLSFFLVERSIEWGGLPVWATCQRLEGPATRLNTYCSLKGRLARGALHLLPTSSLNEDIPHLQLALLGRVATDH